MHPRNADLSLLAFEQNKAALTNALAESGGGAGAGRAAEAREETKRRGATKADTRQRVRVIGSRGHMGKLARIIKETRLQYNVEFEDGSGTARFKKTSVEFFD